MAGDPATEAQRLADALITAANSVAQSSAALQQAQEQFAAQQAATQQAQAAAVPAQQPANTNKFSNAGKMVRMPDPFVASGVDSEQAAWPDFLLNLKAWLCAADENFEADMRHIETHPDVEVDLDVQPDDVQTRARELHSVFVGLLRNRSLKVLRGVPDRNGLEVYRQLVKLYTPNTKPRSMAILAAIMGLPVFGKEKSLYDHLQGLDRLMSEYHKACGQHVPEEVALSVLIRCLPAHIRQHVQLNLEDTTTYSTVRSRILGFESVTNSWSSQRIHNEFGIVGSPSSSSQGPQPMEVDAIQFKGKGKHGKGKSDKGKGKSFSKGKFDKEKGKSSKGKGKQMDAGKNVCLYCHKPGHWKRDCRKFQRDKQNGNVRQVEQSDVQQNGQSSAGIVPSPHTTYAQQAAPTPTPKSAATGQVRRVSFAPMWDDGFSEDSFCDDLSGLRILDGQISVLTMVQQFPGSDEVSSDVFQSFDMTYSDHDDAWTCSPDVSIGHVRMVGFPHMDVDIILDSGADGSALPLEYGHVIAPVDSHRKMHFVVNL